jgi:hypothetical protein
MLKRVQKKNDDYLNQFKISIKNKMVESNMFEDENGTNLLQFIYDYENLQYQKEDFQKRKRIKNSVPLCDRCSALKAEGNRCTRRRKDQNIFCGTHLKGTPHGVVNAQDTAKSLFKTIKIWAEEVDGIVCHLDNNGNVYDPQDIHQNIKNPKVIAKYNTDFEGTISILS